MKQVKVLLWFDVEDYVTAESDEAFHKILLMLDEVGIRATLKFCTKKIEWLKEKGREDILKLLSKHELCFHTTEHSVHPLPSEFLNDYGFSTGAKAFFEKEKPGFDRLSNLLGQNLCSYGQPGEAWAPQAFAAVRAMGVNTYMDAHPILDINGGMFWYGGILSMTALTNLIHSKHEENQIDLMKAAFDNIDTSGEETVFISIYDHPTELVTTEFWDEVNFSKGINPPELKPSPLRAPEALDQNVEAIRQFIAYTMSKPNVEYITSMDAFKYIKNRKQSIQESELAEYAKAFDGNISFHEIGDGMLCPSEMLSLLAKKATDKYLVPEMYYGPESNEDSKIVSDEISIKALANAVLEQYDMVMGYRQLKSLYEVGDNLINPMDAFATLAKAYTENNDSTTVSKGRLAAADYVKSDYQWGGNWVLFADDFNGDNLTEHTKLQCWTLKPAVV